MCPAPQPQSTPATIPDATGLAALLGQTRRPHAMSLEALDGFFCALIASQAAVGPRAYLPVALGGDPQSGATLNDFSNPGSVISLIIGHRDRVAEDFERKGLHLPYLEGVKEGEVPGRAWARGFMRGIELAREGWGALFADESQGELLVIALVAGELDPKWPRAPLDPQLQHDLVNSMAVAAARSYRHFSAA